MTTSDTAICNQALGAMGARTTITSLAEDSEAARNCQIYYADTRDQLLTMAPWDFAKFTTELTLYKALPGTPENPDVTTATVWSSDWPAPPWFYSYIYPPDCIFARYVIPQFSGLFTALWAPGPGFTPALPQAFPMRFSRAMDKDAQGNPMQVLLTNAPAALLTYTQRLTNVANWSQPFVQALVGALAGKLAIPLAGEKDLMKINYSLANALIEKAREADGNEGLTIQESTPDWIAVRGGGYLPFVADNIADPLVYPSLFMV